MQPISYADSGVNYDAIDPFKRLCQERAAQTSNNARRLGLRSVESSRGESAFVMHEYVRDHKHKFIGHVEEGLGTKNLVADTMYELTGKSYYDQIAQCTVAAIVNDMVTVGTMPASIAMHLGVADYTWFDDMVRARDLISGWGNACDIARCVWGGGETPTLTKLGMTLLAGSAWGIADHMIEAQRIRHGDTIVLVESSGIHANSLSLARKIGDREDSFWRELGHLFFPSKFPLHALPNGYLTELSDGRSYGETLLDPTHIYVGLIEDCLEAGIDIHYVVNITGHGWRKLMRAEQPFTYVIDRLPTQLPIFDFIQKHGPVTDEEAYANFNMGAGFALYIPGFQAVEVFRIAKSLGFRTIVAGHIENGEKKVVIKPKGLEYKAETLGVR